MKKFFFPRKLYAERLARLLAEADAKEGQSKNVKIISGYRSIGKSTFAKNDLAPKLKDKNLEVLIFEISNFASLDIEAIGILLLDAIINVFENIKNSININGIYCENSFKKTHAPESIAKENVFDERLRFLVNVLQNAQIKLIVIIDDFQALTVLKNSHKSKIFKELFAQPIVSKFIVFCPILTLSSSMSRGVLAQYFDLDQARIFEFEEMGAEFVEYVNSNFILDSTGSHAEFLYGEYLGLGSKPALFIAASNFSRQDGEFKKESFSKICNDLALNAARLDLQFIASMSYSAQMALLRLSNEWFDYINNRKAIPGSGEFLIERGEYQYDKGFDELLRSKIIFVDCNNKYRVSDPLIYKAWRASWVSLGI